MTVCIKGETASFGKYYKEALGSLLLHASMARPWVLVYVIPEAHNPSRSVSGTVCVFVLCSGKLAVAVWNNGPTTIFGNILHQVTQNKYSRLTKHHIIAFCSITYLTPILWNSLIYTILKP